MDNIFLVFKKASPNGKLTVYLGKRDFVDHIDVVDPVDGVVLVDPEYLKERKVFVTLTCAFRYGREDLDVLGLTFRKDLFVANIQAFPPVPEEKKPLTRLQERLIKKLGEHAYPFTFERDLGLQGNLPCAKENSVRLVIRKVQYAPERPGPQPMAETTRQFLMSDKPLHLEASLDKELPFTLMHPKPKEEPLHREAPENEAPIDTNLIEFDTNDDDIVFEDFARQRLKGMKDDKEEEDEGTNSPPMNDR
uniref:Beta-arrestin-1 n=1 Tax=Pyxicephalus adspersus TaxID=30357 RepID=A0AAV3ATK3_PYXAD|nr:TPA: hypothetical protein GDO54_000052 [Pyxicephalus adspersus]